MQAMFWISLLKGRVRKPLPPPHYYLLVKETARIKYGVDHSTYMSTLAKDIGAAPVCLPLQVELVSITERVPGSFGIVAYVRNSRSALLHVWSGLYDILPSFWTIPITHGSNSDKD
jgi:hypothetical protein